MHEKEKKGIKYTEGMPPRVWVSIEKKVQVRDYEPIGISAGYSRDLEENEKVQDAFKDCFKKVKSALIPEIKNLILLKNK